MHIKRRKTHQFRGNLDAFIEKNPDARAYFSLKASEKNFNFPQPGRIDGVKSMNAALMRMTGCSFTHQPVGGAHHAAQHLCVVPSQTNHAISLKGPC